MVYKHTYIYKYESHIIAARKNNYLFIYKSSGERQQLPLKTDI